MATFCWQPQVHFWSTFGNTWKSEANVVNWKLRFKKIFINYPKIKIFLIFFSTQPNGLINTQFSIVINEPIKIHWKMSHFTWLCWWVEVFATHWWPPSQVHFGLWPELSTLWVTIRVNLRVEFPEPFCPCWLWSHFLELLFHLELDFWDGGKKRLKCKHLVKSKKWD